MPAVSLMGFALAAAILARADAERLPARATVAVAAAAEMGPVTSGVKS